MNDPGRLDQDPGNCFVVRINVVHFKDQEKEEMLSATRDITIRQGGAIFSSQSINHGAILFTSRGRGVAEMIGIVSTATTVMFRNPGGLCLGGCPGCVM